MKAVRLGLVLCFALFLASCTLKPTWDLLGKWEKVDSGEILEFSGKGTVSLTSETTQLHTTYKLIDSKFLHINLGSLGVLAAEISATSNTLKLTDAAGKVTEYKKTR